MGYLCSRVHAVLGFKALASSNHSPSTASCVGLSTLLGCRYLPSLILGFASLSPKS